MKNISEKLKQNKLKATPQRIAIYDYLYNHCNHPNAETIYAALKEDYPAMSLATVYKTVATLRDANIIQEINVGEDSFRYDACTDNHSHIICTKCHKVFDYFNTFDFKNDVKNIAQDMNIDVHSQQVYFYGVCDSCKKL